MFPGELKKILAQVVQARQEGLAALAARSDSDPNAGRTGRSLSLD
jgi:hypothetical protein